LTGLNVFTNKIEAMDDAKFNENAEMKKKLDDLKQGEFFYCNNL